MLKLTNITWLGTQRARPSTLDFIQAKLSVQEVSTNPFLSHVVTSDTISEAVNSVSNGLVDAEYRVSRTTNWGASVFPEVFSFSVFAHSPQGRLLVQRYQGVVESVGAGNAFLPFPESPGKYSVRDYRFNDSLTGVDEISYAQTNFHWIAASDAMLTEQFEKAKRMAVLNQTHTGKAANQKMYRYAILFTLFTVTLFFVWKLKQPETISSL